MESVSYSNELSSVTQRPPTKFLGATLWLTAINLMSEPQDHCAEMPKVLGTMAPTFALVPPDKNPAIASTRVITLCE